MSMRRRHLPLFRHHQSGRWGIWQVILGVCRISDPGMHKVCAKLDGVRDAFGVSFEAINATSPTLLHFSQRVRARE